MKYKGVIVGDYDADLIVSVRRRRDQSNPQYDKRDEAQLLNELKATGLKVGLLVNFSRTKLESNASSSKSVFHPCSSVAK